MRKALDVQLTGGNWSPDNASSSTFETEHFRYALSDEGVTITRIGTDATNYELFMGNIESSGQNTCSGGRVCTAAKGLGFTYQETED